MGHRKRSRKPALLDGNYAFLHGNSNCQTAFQKVMREKQIPALHFESPYSIFKSDAGKQISCIAFGIAERKKSFPEPHSEK